MLRAIGLTRVFLRGSEQVRALDGVNLEIGKGEFLRILGASGSGKSTLLNLLAGLDRPTSGTIETPAGVLSEMSSRQLAGYRAGMVGMVFQTFNLIAHRSALQNVEVGMLFLGLPKAERLRRAAETLEQLGLGDRLHHRPAALSGGEAQRVALARALAKQPRLLLADEPTGNLDRSTSATLARILGEFNRRGLTIVLVTHDVQLAAETANRTLEMSYGRIVEERAHRENAPPATASGGPPHAP
jgi:putative ABC transport system ATP-binding protein